MKFFLFLAFFVSSFAFGNFEVPSNFELKLWQKTLISLDTLKTYHVNNTLCKNQENFRACIHTINSLYSAKNEIMNFFVPTENEAELIALPIVYTLKEILSLQKKYLGFWSSDSSFDFEQKIDDLKEDIDREFETYLAVKGLNAFYQYKFGDMSGIEHLEIYKQSTIGTKKRSTPSIGLTPTFDSFGRMIVVETYPTGPSDNAGLIEGDTILTFNGLDANRENLSEIQKFCSNTTPIKITYERKGEEFKTQILPKVFNIKNITLNKVEDFAHIKIRSFRPDNTAYSLKKAIEYANSRGFKGIIIDVRNNTGGSTPQAISAVELFSKRKKQHLLTIHNFEFNTVTKVKSKIKGINKLPVVVLIDHLTASAAEIFAGSLKDISDAVLIGRRTFGKGTLIKKDRYPHLLKIVTWTNNAFFTFPSGYSNHLNGIVPNIEIQKSYFKSEDRLEELTLNPIMIPEEFNQIQFSDSVSNNSAFEEALKYLNTVR